jgi:tRNA 2-thiouridine synthesizing protein E
MPLEVNGRIVDTDDEGFLLEPDDWDHSVAEALARQEKIDMTDNHWQIIEMVREHLEHSQCVPEARILLKTLAKSIGKDNATRRYLYQLFPYGYGQQACKIAGTRKPLKLMLDV